MFNKNTSIITILLKKDHIIIKIKDDAKRKEICDELKKKMPELKNFYQEEQTPILVTGKMLKMAEMDEIQSIIQKELKVKIEFDSPREMGLSGIKHNFRKEIKTSETKFYKGSIRSGQRVEFEGSVVIIGDVNDSAEVIAEDNIVVLGILRGLAHAGAKGNEDAIVAAKIIDSPQIRIGSIILQRSREDIETGAFTFAYVNEYGKIELE